MRINPLDSLVPIDDLLAKTDNERHRKILNNYRTHLLAELTGDIDLIMSTMIKDPVYHTYGVPRAIVPKGAPVGGAAVREFYSDTFSDGRNVLVSECDRMAVSDWGLAADTMLRVIHPGHVLKEQGADIDDPDAHYLLSVRIGMFLPYDDDCLMMGEDAYADFEGAEIAKLAPEEVVRREDLLAELA